MHGLVRALCAAALLLQVEGAHVAASSDGTALLAPGEVDRRVLASGTAGPIVARGRLLDAGRHGSAGLVAALALPSEAFNRTIRIGDTVRTPTIGWARAARDGSFRIKIDPSLLSSAEKERGHRVNLLLVGWNEHVRGEWAMTVDTRPARGRPLPAATIRLVTPNERAAVVATGRPQPDYCSRTLRSTFDAWSIIGETWPYGPHTGSVTMSVGQSTSVGFASSTSGKAGSWTQTGSLSTSTSVSSDFGGMSAAYRDYRMEIRYGRYESTCGHWFEERLYATGGMVPTALDSRDFPTSWSHCVSTYGTWSRTTSDGYSYSLAGGVLIAPLLGINLSLNTTYSENRTISYRYASSYKVCGNNDVPSRASRIRSGA
jgi:hypothetical protein